jgi:cyclophilin family peptidyl-prolyl cis-trans isomerase
MRRLTKLLLSDCFLSTQVTEGFDIVEKISKVPTHNESPKEPIEMLSIRIS